MNNELINYDRMLRDLLLSVDERIAWRINGDFPEIQSILKWQTKLLVNSAIPKNRKEKTLLKYRYILLYEWEIVPGMSQYGVGDLVFSDGNGNFAVMEVKHIISRSGKNQSVKRRKARRKVKEQTIKYMSVFKRKVPEAKSIIGIAVASDEWTFYS